MERTPREAYAAESRLLNKGKLTLITGPSRSTRSRFIFGMLSGIMNSSRNNKAPAIWCFNRRWTDWEAMKALLHDATSRLMHSGQIPDTDAWIMAIEQVAQSGLVYDTTRASIEEICRTVRMEHDKAPGKLLIVDGLEYFQSNSKEETPLSKLPEMLDQLRTLALETMLPVIASCPPLHLLNDATSLVAADYIIELHDKSDQPQ
jgi:replicative DNA helicase